MFGKEKALKRFKSLVHKLHMFIVVIVVAVVVVVVVVAVVVVVTPPFPRDGHMAEDHGVPEAGKLPGPVPEVLERQKVAK